LISVQVHLAKFCADQTTIPAITRSTRQRHESTTQREIRNMIPTAFDVYEMNQM
jgi:hypothetical protein